MPGKGLWPGEDSGLSPQVTDDKKHILSEEALLILNSGEVPEVAYYGSTAQSIILPKILKGLVLILNRRISHPLRKPLFGATGLLF